MHPSLALHNILRVLATRERVRVPAIQHRPRATGPKSLPVYLWPHSRLRRNDTCIHTCRLYTHTRIHVQIHLHTHVQLCMHCLEKPQSSTFRHAMPEGDMTKHRACRQSGTDLLRRHTSNRPMDGEARLERKMADPEDWLNELFRMKSVTAGMNGPMWDEYHEKRATTTRAQEGGWATRRMSGKRRRSKRPGSLAQSPVRPQGLHSSGRCSARPKACHRSDNPAPKLWSWL